MSDAEKLIWGAACTLVVAAVCYVAKRIVEKRADRVVLDSGLSICVNAETIERVGCPGMLLSITCRSNRPAKLKGADLSVVLTKDDLATFERGFQSSLGQSSNEELPPPRLHVPLLPISSRTNASGLVLERDDVATFLFPIATAALPLFLKAPSEEVQATALFSDGSRRILERGLSIQTMLQDVVAACGSLPMQLKVPMEMNVTVSANGVPDIGQMIGRTNSEAISFVGPQEPAVEEAFTEERMVNCMSIVREIMNDWSLSKRLRYVVVPSQEIDAEDVLRAADTTFKIGVTEPVHIIGLIDLLVVFSVLAQQATALRNADAAGHSTFSVRSQATTRYSRSQVSAILRQISFSNPARSAVDLPTGGMDREG